MHLRPCSLVLSGDLDSVGQARSRARLLKTMCQTGSKECERGESGIGGRQYRGIRCGIRVGAWWDPWPKPWDPHVRSTVNIVGSAGDTSPFYNIKREQMLKTGPAVCSDSFVSRGPTFLEFYRSAGGRTLQPPLKRQSRQQCGTDGSKARPPVASMQRTLKRRCRQGALRVSRRAFLAKAG